MTTTRYAPVTSVDASRGSGMGFIVLLGIVALGVWYFSAQHAVERHGAVAEDIVNQCQQGKWLQAMRNPATGRQARICQLSDGKFAIAIYDKMDEIVTAFEKEKMRTIEQVRTYLMNVGYKP
jgi:hypothetical protein